MFLPIFSRYNQLFCSVGLTTRKNNKSFSNPKFTKNNFWGNKM